MHQFLFSDLWFPIKSDFHFAHLTAFFWFGKILGLASRAEFLVSLSTHAGFTPWLLYSTTSTPHSPVFIHLKTGWSQDAWLQWSYYANLSKKVRELVFPSWYQPLTYTHLTTINAQEILRCVLLSWGHIFLFSKFSLSPATCWLDTFTDLGFEGLHSNDTW